MSLLDKIKDFFKFNEHLEDEIEDEIENTAPPIEEKKQYTRKRQVNENGTIDISGFQNAEMMIVQPENYDDASRVVKLIRNRVGVVLSFVDLSMPETNKNHIIDFICGAICALDGNQKVIAKDVYMFTPGNIEIGTLKKNNTIDAIDTVLNNTDKLFFTIDDLSSGKKNSKVS